MQSISQRGQEFPAPKVRGACAVRPRRCVLGARGDPRPFALHGGRAWEHACLTSLNPSWGWGKVEGGEERWPEARTEAGARRRHGGQRAESRAA